MGTGVIDQVERTKLGQEQRVGPGDGEGNRYYKPLAFGSPCFLVIYGLPTIIAAFPQRGRESHKRVDGCGTL